MEGDLRWKMTDGGRVIMGEVSLQKSFSYWKAHGAGHIPLCGIFFLLFILCVVSNFQLNEERGYKQGKNMIQVGPRQESNSIFCCLKAKSSFFFQSRIKVLIS